jgi:hypothetical protein
LVDTVAAVVAEAEGAVAGAAVEAEVLAHEDSAVGVAVSSAAEGQPAIDAST